MEFFTVHIVPVDKWMQVTNDNIFLEWTQQTEQWQQYNFEIVNDP